MRKFFLLLLLYLCQQTYSQEVNVVSVKQLPGTDVGKAYHPKFSPTGEYLLFTSDNYSGLKKYDLKNGKVTVVTKRPMPDIMFRSVPMEIIFSIVNNH